MLYQESFGEGMTTTATDGELRNEIRFLGQILGEVIEAKEGSEMLHFEEQIRALSKARRRGDKKAEAQVRSLLENCDENALFAVCRAFTIFFDLANLAEDRHRVRILRRRERDFEPLPRRESIRDAVRLLKDHGVDGNNLEEILRCSVIEPVFTAHPTEAKRRVLRSKLRRIRIHLEDLERQDLLERERSRLRAAIRSELITMWETDLLRVKKPTVIEELDRSIFFLDSLWMVVPRLLADLQEAVHEYYPDLGSLESCLFRFGSWIGGDRDGNPFVTPAITLQTLHRLRTYTLRKHRKMARDLGEVLTQSAVRIQFDAHLMERLEAQLKSHPALTNRLNGFPEEEVYRRFLALIDWRLEQTQGEGSASYRCSRELVEDLETLARAVECHRGGGNLTEPALQDWLACAKVFGFHTARLDIRENSDVYSRAVADMLAEVGLAPDYLNLSEAERLRILAQVLQTSVPLSSSGWSEQTQTVVDLFGVLQRYTDRTEGEGLGAHIVSMTRAASDILGLFWLQKTFAPGLQQPLVPLLETVDDLQNGPKILEDLWAHPGYRQRIEDAGSQQMVMIGYSDSTKDSGFLSANWNLYQAQRQLAEAAERHSLRLLFFHGRGGSLGRGGGPAARSILSLPVKVAKEGLRVTEQGEVLSERYDDPAIAYRHLEQLTWAQLSLHEPEHEDNERLADRYAPLLDKMAESSRGQYRELLASPGFLRFFREVTPIAEIEQLPIGSRPSRRVSEPTIEGLRAIPWSFAWTQARILLPAWFGLGKAIAQANLNELRAMFQEWSFFKALISNASLALAKADMGIAVAYAERQRHDQEVWKVWEAIESDYRLTVEQVLRVTQEDEILGSIPWLGASIRRRNPYVDPLNLIQLRAFDLSKEGNTSGPILMRIAIKGVAAGLRTTG